MTIALYAFSLLRHEARKSAAAQLCGEGVRPGAVGLGTRLSAGGSVADGGPGTRAAVSGLFHAYEMHISCL